MTTGVFGILACLKIEEITDFLQEDQFQGEKVYLHLVSSEIIDFYDRIENLETKLDSRFFRCHRSYLINLRHLKSYKNGMAYMESGEEIPVSRLRSKEFSGVILQYMKEWRL